MISDLGSVQYYTSLPGVAPKALAAVPSIAYNLPSDAEYRTHLNVDALDAAVPDDSELGGRENANRCAQVLAPLVKTLKYYVEQGKGPVRVQSSTVVGRLQEGAWTFFLPSSGFVMRCDEALSFGSQTFEARPEYLALAADKVNNGSLFPYVPWQMFEYFLSSGLDSSIPSVSAFWSLHVKTAEVI